MCLSAEFLAALSVGHLNPLLSLARSDRTLSAQIGPNRLRVYYRGGLALGVSELAPGALLASFDAPRYANRNGFGTLPGWESVVESARSVQGPLNDARDVARILNALPAVKWLIDGWQSACGGAEGAFVQLIERENNLDFPASDYFVCDTEYEGPFDADGTSGTVAFDFVGVRWPTNERRNGRSKRLVLGEAKYGDGAVTGHHGVAGHLRRADQLVRTAPTFATLKRAMLERFNQRLQLGLICNQHVLESWSDEKPIWLLLLGNHDPESTLLGHELQECVALHAKGLAVEPRVAVANFMGTALFDPAIHSLVDFSLRFKQQVNSAPACP